MFFMRKMDHETVGKPCRKMRKKLKIVIILEACKMAENGLFCVSGKTLAMITID